MMKNKCPLSPVEDVFDCSGQALVFSKLDLCFGSYQVCIAEGNKPKTIYITCYRFFEFLIMSFDLTNAHTTFCSLIDIIFRLYINDL